MKKSISRETLLVYPNFSKLFVIHKDASKVQLGAVISQDNTPIGFYSRKTESCIAELQHHRNAETLKELRNIFLGQKIKVFTDHKNLIYKSVDTEIVMR